MRILIAYDGSEGANIAIEGLQHAGLPFEKVDALVVSVAEVWLPPPVSDTSRKEIPPDLKLAREYVARIIAEVEDLSEVGTKHVRSIFPLWSLHHKWRAVRRRLNC
jgi:hypothetical protein